MPMSEGQAPDEEVDVWWGGYAARTMVPSLVVCVVLTVLIDLMCWLTLPRYLLRWSVVSLTGLLWLVQTLRWLHHLLGYNYRLTTRRLYVEHGLFAPETAVADLDRIKAVKVAASLLQRRLGVGKVAVYVDDDAQLPLILDGVLHPWHVREMIARQAGQAKKTLQIEAP
jgi:membrane protein YdbS with pleckstrin-like domain